EVFHRECHEKKQKILEITNFFEYLTEKDYVHRIYQGLAGRPVLPNQYDKTWRKYSDFYMDLMSGLSFVCLAVFTPKLKLYRLWEHSSVPQTSVTCPPFHSPPKEPRY
ncbi:MAG: hypothetical protein LBK43_06470, partial [Treponema sp.]|nr:hypothetical protein [Treponema sp.]